MSEPKIVPLLLRHEVSRRELLHGLGAGIAALAAGCLSRAGDEDIVPYVVEPPELVPGMPQRYTSVLALDGYGIGVIAATREGRPIKIDGNPAHPASGGGSPPWLQARILDLYDPQRSAAARMAGMLATWPAIADRLRATRGPLWLVMPPQSSPAFAALLARLREVREVHVVYDAALAGGAAYRGAAQVYGQPLAQQLDLARADIVLGLDADFLAGMPMSAAWARAAAARRRPDARMNRLWVCEPVPTPTGTLADERLAIPAGDVACVATCVLAELAASHGVPRELVARARERLGDAAGWASAVAGDLARRRGAGAVIAGDRQPAVVHALARMIDHACGNTGGPVTFTKPALLDSEETLANLALAAHTGGVGAVIVLDADPVYTAPRASGVAAALAAAPLTVHVGLHVNQTTQVCGAHVPLAHELEAWGAARAWDGTLAIAQPLVRPRFEVVSALDVLAALFDEPFDARAQVREACGGLDAAAWTAALRAGVVAGTRSPPVDPGAPAWSSEATAQLSRELAAPAGAAIASRDSLPASSAAEGRRGTIEIALAASPQVHDGRFAPNAWLQELPHPITKQTWGNAALVSQRTAATLDVADEDLLVIATPAGQVTLPALLVDGTADDSITIELGHGQRVPETPIADRVGGNGYALRQSERAIVRGTVRRAAGSARVARTQHTITEHGRDVAPVATLAGFLAQPEFVAHLRGDQPSLLPVPGRDGVQWGMSIDTSICTGCSACMVACQAENNIPTIGPGDVARGRHMNWLRIDRYVKDDGTTVNQPMPCQHCEHAPCEYVCPVMATTHSPDGLNEQVYNRCIGTRFCSNNCPYKVRRFNWFAYEQPTSRALQYNPDVTVRSRGVIEKCTYCVQRIRRAENAALVEHRALRVGEVTTACQDACPTGAIRFGQLAEAGTVFAALRRDVRRFEVLHDLGTRPRTQYLAKITNPRGRR